MNPESRTAKSIKNSYVALAFYAINFALSFVSRKVFLDNLGPEILGLNSTAASLFGFLNLAELGIGTAIAVTLYKPLQAKDQDAINEVCKGRIWTLSPIWNASDWTAKPVDAKITHFAADREYTRQPLFKTYERKNWRENDAD